jgi:mono/diheme cytochrome c family protein
MAVPANRARRGLASLALALACGLRLAAADDKPVDPFLGQPQAIEEGEQIYKGKCIICHGKAGGRGPNLFATRLRDDQFLATVTHGRPGTLMPVFGLRLSQDEIWKVHAFLKAHPNGL